MSAELRLQPVVAEPDVMLMPRSTDMIYAVPLTRPGKRLVDVIPQHPADGNTGIIGIEPAVHSPCEHHRLFPVADNRISYTVPSRKCRKAPL